MLSPAVDAAAKSTSHKGTFTAEAYRQSLGKGKSKRMLAKGEVPMQESAEDAWEVLGRKVPDSGTPLRGITSMIGLGAVGGPAVGIDPLTGAVVAGAIGSSYTKPGMKAIAAVLAKRPELAKNLTPLLTGAGASGAITNLGN
jgi:hypothetical protein